MTRTSVLGAGAAAAAVLVLGLGAPAHAASTIVVYETTAATQGWASPPVTGTNTAGSLDWTADGLVLSTPLGTDKVQLGTALDMPLDELTSLSYVAEVLAAGNPASQNAALNVVIDFNGDALGGFATLVYEPVYNGGSLDAVRGGDAVWWSTRAMPGVPTAFSSFVPLSTIIAANPDAVIDALLINQGSGNAGLVTLVSSITLGDSTNVFREGTPPVALGGKAECKDGGWQTSAAPEFRNQGECVSFFTSNR